MSELENDDGDPLGLFEEPRDYYKPEAEPTFATHTLRSGDTLSVRLVGNNPLWVRNDSAKLHPHARFLIP
jgi:nicotinamide N-methyltransferase